MERKDPATSTPDEASQTPIDITSMSEPAATAQATKAATTTTTSSTTVVSPAQDSEDDEDALDPLPPAAADEDPDAKHKYRFDDGFVIDYREDPKVELIGTEPDPQDGYRPVTWKQLERIFCYERVAKGYKLCGDISQKHREHWERSKQIRVRDKDGGEGALFFYDDNDPEPNFSWSDVEVGNVIEIKSPRLHKFMDGQDGMRVESNKSVLRVSKVRFTDDKRLEYGVLNKNNGNAQFELAIKAKAKEELDEKVCKEKGIPYKKVSNHMPNSAAKLFDNAINFYDMAIGHLERTLFTESIQSSDPTAVQERDRKRQVAKETLAACFLNIAASQILQKNWSSVEGPCDKALAVNASKSLNAKAYFRAGHALLEQGHLRMAEEKLKRADQLKPDDGKIQELLHRIAVIRYEEQKNEKEMFQLRQRKRNQQQTTGEEKKDEATNNISKDATTGDATSPTPSATTNTDASATGKMNPNYGIRRSLFGPPQAVLRGVPNFRDVGSYLCNDGKTITKKYMLYRSSNLFDVTTGAAGETSNDLRVLTEELGVKTVIDMRNDREIEVMKKDAEKLRAEGGIAVRLKKLRAECKAAGKKFNPNNNDDAANNSSAGSSAEASEEDSGSDVSQNSDDDEASIADKKRERAKRKDERVAIRKAKKAAAAAASGKKLKTKTSEKKGDNADAVEEEPTPITGPFVDYRDYFTTIKVITEPKKQEKKKSTASASGEPTMKSPAEDTSASSSSPTSTTAAGGAMATLKHLFMLLSSGGTAPSLVDRTNNATTITTSAATPNSNSIAAPSGRVWMRMMRPQKLVACPKLEPSISTTTNTKNNKSVDEEIKSAIANRRVILNIDIVTRSFINAVSVWVLFVVSLFFLTFQMKAASKYMARKVVAKGPSYMYRIMVDDQGPEIAQIFATAANEANYPILITCALGKDRTGVIIALLLAAADVQFSYIAHDYANLTNNGLASDVGQILVNQQKEMGVKGPQWETADAKDIKALFLHLKEKYGGLHAYLAKIGVTTEQIQSLRRILTKPVAK